LRSDLVVSAVEYCASDRRFALVISGIQPVHTAVMGSVGEDLNTIGI